MKVIQGRIRTARRKIAPARAGDEGPVADLSPAPRSGREHHLARNVSCFRRGKKAHGLPFLFYRISSMSTKRLKSTVEWLQVSSSLPYTQKTPTQKIRTRKTRKYQCEWAETPDIKRALQHLATSAIVPSKPNTCITSSNTPIPGIFS